MTIEQLAITATTRLNTALNTATTPDVLSTLVQEALLTTGREAGLTVITGDEPGELFSAPAELEAVEEDGVITLLAPATAEILLGLQLAAIDDNQIYATAEILGSSVRLVVYPQPTVYQGHVIRDFGMAIEAYL